MAMVQDLSKDNYTFKTHSKLEYLADLERSSNFDNYLSSINLSDQSLKYSDKFKYWGFT